VREIRTLRAMWRGLETESRTTLHGHEGRNPGYRQGEAYDHRASPRPYRAPTLRDSTVALGQYYSKFFIRAATNTPTKFFDSASDIGYSVDNLSPGVPSSFAYNAGQLSWNESAAADFDYFTVYGSTSTRSVPPPWWTAPSRC